MKYPLIDLDIPERIDTPSLVIDLDRVTQNLERMQDAARLRRVDLVPHFKTHRTIEFARLQAELGASAFCIAKLGEAEALYAAGFRRFVMAYPIIGDSKIDRALRLSENCEILLSVDSIDAAEAVNTQAARLGRTAEILILVDTGYHREGVPPEAVVSLAGRISTLKSVRLRGVLTHEGHASAADNQDELKAISLDSGEMMIRLASDLRNLGYDIDVVSVGSTASAQHIIGVTGITQVRPGIYPFNDYGQLLRGSAELTDCAAVVISTVVSSVRSGHALIDAGSKALSQDQLRIWDPKAPSEFGLIIGHPGWIVDRLSEEHGWLRWTGDGSPTAMTIGMRLAILPNHICSVFHVLGRSEIIRDGEHVATWVATARGESR